MTDRSRMTMRELLAEAERREIAGAEWMDRTALLRALDEGERRAGGALARARRFFGQVTGLDRVVRVVRGAIDPEKPDPPAVVGPERASASPSPGASANDPPRASDLLADDPSFGGLGVVTRDGRSWLVWRAPSTRLAAIGRGTDLTLRLVSIGCAIGEPDAEVVIETADEPGLALEGVRPIPAVALGRQCVAAIGVGRGDEFVSVAHARVA